MRAAIFKDEAIQAQFEKDGFVKLALLDEAEIEDLASMREHYFPERGSVFFSSSYLDDFELKMEISERIKKTIESKIEEHFINYRLIGAAYLIKGVGPHSEMPMHQDWTIVDERQFYAVNIWIPLTDTNEENGTLELMKGSHRWNNALRAPTLPMSFDGLQWKILPKLTVVEAKLGEVIILRKQNSNFIIGTKSVIKSRNFHRTMIFCSALRILWKRSTNGHSWGKVLGTSIILFQR